MADQNLDERKPKSKAASRREILAKQYARGMLRGDRAGAKRIWRDLFATTCAALRE